MIKVRNLNYATTGPFPGWTWYGIDFLKPYGHKEIYRQSFSGEKTYYGMFFVRQAMFEEKII